MTGSAPLLWLGLSAIAGVLASGWWSCAPSILLGCFLICCTLTLIPRSRWVGLLTSTFFCFWFYALVKLASISPHDVKLLWQAEQSYAVRGKVVSAVEYLEHDRGIQHRAVLEVHHFQNASNTWQECEGRIRVSFFANEKLELFDYGVEVDLPIFVNATEEPRNPGQMNWERWNKINGIDFHAFSDAQSIRFISVGAGNWVQTLALALRKRLIASIEDNRWWSWMERFEGIQKRTEMSHLIQALLLGDTRSLSNSLYQSFLRTGTLHIFAISGQNVGAMCLLMILILQWLGLIRWRWAWVWIPWLFLFCLAAGMPSSAARAWTMLSLIFVGWVLLRPISMVNLWGASVLILLVWSPADLWNIGFQLSYGIVLCLMLLTPPLNTLLQQWWSPDPWIPERLLPRWRIIVTPLLRTIALTFSATLSAWIGSFPPLLYYFNQVVPVGLISNLAVSPLASVAMVICSLSLPLHFFGLSYVTNFLASLLLQLIVMFNGMAMQIPHGFFYWNPRQPPSAQRLVVLSHGQSYPLLIQSNNGFYLVNTGEEQMWQSVLRPAQAYYSINQWEGIILSQNHKTSWDTLPLIFENHRIGWIAENGLSSNSAIHSERLKQLAEHELGRRFFRAGDRVPLDSSMKLTILSPEEYHPWKRSHEKGLVMLLEWGEEKILWASEISPNVEQWLIQRYPNLRCEVLIQGGNHNLSPQWVAHLQPRYLIRPQLPFAVDTALSPELWNVMRNLKTQFYHMERTGAITLEKVNGELAVKPYR